MTTPTLCPTCQAPLPADTPASACPRCLLAAGLPQSGEGAADDADNASSRAQIAAQFPELEILELVGRGGMGVVYRVRQKALDRIAALKVLPESLREEPGFSERFAREARTMARLDHPHIVRVHDFGVRDERFYLLMEYIDGASLRRVIDAGGLEAAEALRIVPLVCQALQYAHDRGVVHRDIKPGNVLIGKNGDVKVTDFGLAKLVHDDPSEQTLTQTGQVMGTWHYMAPEQYRTPDDVDHRADIYSLGVVFYEMLTGEVPMGRFEAPSNRVQVDVRLDGVVLRTLERERERRYQHADDLRSEVATIIAGPEQRREDLPPPPLPLREPPVREARLSRAALWGFLCAPAAVILPVLLALLAGAAGIGAVWAIVMGSAFLLLLTGFCLSLAGWISVVRSEGRLRGLGFAVAGTILPLLFVVFGGSVMLLGVREVEPEFDPALRRPVRRHAAWGRLADAVADGVVSPGELDMLVAKTERRRVDLLRAEDRERLRTQGLLGPVYMPRNQLPRDLKRMGREGWDVLSGEVARASLTMGTGHDALTVRLLQDREMWTYALAPVVFPNRPSKAPLAQLVEGPITHDFDRSAIQTQVEVLWSIYRGFWEAGELPLGSRVPAAHLSAILAPSDVATLTDGGLASLAEQGKDGALGLLFLDAASLPRPLAHYALASIRVGPSEDRALVKAQAADSEIEFSILQERSRWWLASEPARVTGR